MMIPISKLCHSTFCGSSRGPYAIKYASGDADIRLGLHGDEIFAILSSTGQSLPHSIVAVIEDSEISQYGIIE